MQPSIVGKKVNVQYIYVSMSHTTNKYIETYWKIRMGTFELMSEIFISK